MTKEERKCIAEVIQCLVIVAFCFVMVMLVIG